MALPPATTSITTTNAKAIDYGIDPWKVAIIDARARRRGIRHDELPDVRQDLAPIIAAFRFDPAKSNGACERTVLISVIDNQLTMLLRTRARWQQFREDYAEAVAKEEQERVERREAAHEVESDRRTDVEHALRRLWEPDQEIARGLARGESQRDLSIRLNRSRYDIDQAIRRIREIFLDGGLEAWVRG